MKSNGYQTFIGGKDDEAVYYEALKVRSQKGKTFHKKREINSRQYVGDERVSLKWRGQLAGPRGKQPVI